MQGTWYYGSATPLERPLELGNKRAYTEAEARAIIAGHLDFDTERLKPSDPDRAAPEKGAEIGQEADANFITTRSNLTRIGGEFRTSLIIDPPDGRLPFREGGMDIFDEWRAAGFDDFENHEMRPASERCLNVGGPISPMVGWRYNANMRIVQTPDHVMLKGEMQEPRILGLNGATRNLGFRRWLGESEARWEGDVLRVHTTNFRPDTSWFYFKHSDQLEVEEAFRMTGPDEIFYRYTVTDPEIYSVPFTVEMSITRRPPDERIYEFACHEGNHSFAVIMRGARVLEAEAADRTSD